LLSGSDSYFRDGDAARHHVTLIAACYARNFSQSMATGLTHDVLWSRLQFNSLDQAIMFASAFANLYFRDEYAARHMTLIASVLRA
jgi:hypothetical protein